MIIIFFKIIQVFRKKWMIGATIIVQKINKEHKFLFIILMKIIKTIKIMNRHYYNLIF